MTSTAVATRPRAGDVVLITFIGVVAMLFAGFTAAYLIRRSGTDWTPIELPKLVWVSSALLIVSSVTVEAACRRRNKALLLVSLALGTAFLLCQIVTWRQLAGRGIYLPSNPHGAFYYVLSAVHGVHLLGGLFALVFVVLRDVGSRPCAIYWHFMGLVWIYLLFLLSF